MTQRGGTERVEFYQDVDDLWRFRRVSANNHVLAQGEDYQNHADAVSTVKAIFLRVAWWQGVSDGWQEVPNGEVPAADQAG